MDVEPVSQFEFEEESIGSDDEGDYYKEEKKNDQQTNQFEEEFLKFMNKRPTNANQPRTLGDLLAEKIKERREQLNRDLNQQDADKKVDKNVLELYKEVGVVMSKYTSGKLPKAFKIIPSLSNWEQLVQLTKPEKWSSAGMYEATRLFIANLKENQVQKFVNRILLPRVRDDILTNRKLNIHLYKSLQKALFKPGKIHKFWIYSFLLLNFQFSPSSGAFFKGIIIPLCEGADCSHKEASIIGSILARNSIPLLHSCAAMLRIAEMEYTGANSLFLNFLIQKKYALPFRVIDALVFHFVRMSDDKRTLPTLWHKCFLGFVEFYKKDISQEQKDALLASLSNQWNAAYSPQVSKHLKDEVVQEIKEAEGSKQNVDDQMALSGDEQMEE